MFTSTSDNDDRADDVDELADRLARLEQRVDRLAADHEAPAEETAIDDLRRSFNALQRKQRDLKDTMENTVLAYMEEERDTLDTLTDRVKDAGELMRELKQTRDRIDRVERRLDSKVDDSTLSKLQDDIDQQHDALMEKHDELLRRIKQLETRVSILASDEPP